MTSLSLAQNYLMKAKSRLTILKNLQDLKDYSDVVREAQEIVELCLKALLRYSGIDPPKWHDVGPLLVEYQRKFPSLDQKTIERLADISFRLTEQRELAFYGDEDFIPSEEYHEKDGIQAMQEAAYTVSIAESVIH